MHEMALAEELIHIIEDSASAEQFRRVKTIWLEVGVLSCVEPSAMVFCFEAVSKSTLAEGAQVRIKRVEAKGYCQECGESFLIGARYDPCPACLSHRVDVTQGTDLRISQLEGE